MTFCQPVQIPYKDNIEKESSLNVFHLQDSSEFSNMTIMEHNYNATEVGVCCKLETLCPSDTK